MSKTVFQICLYVLFFCIGGVFSLSYQTHRVMKEISNRDGIVEVEQLSEEYQINESDLSFFAEVPSDLLPSIQREDSHGESFVKDDTFQQPVKAVVKVSNCRDNATPEGAICYTGDMFISSVPINIVRHRGVLTHEVITFPRLIFNTNILSEEASPFARARSPG